MSSIVGLPSGTNSTTNNAPSNTISAPSASISSSQAQIGGLKQKLIDNQSALDNIDAQMNQVRGGAPVTCDKNNPDTWKGYIDQQNKFAPQIAPLQAQKDKLLAERENLENQAISAGLNSLSASGDHSVDQLAKDFSAGMEAHADKQIIDLNTDPVTCQKQREEQKKFTELKNTAISTLLEKSSSADSSDTARQTLSADFDKNIADQREIDSQISAINLANPVTCDQPGAMDRMKAKNEKIAPLQAQKASLESAYQGLEKQAIDSITEGISA